MLHDFMLFCFKAPEVCGQDENAYSKKNTKTFGSMPASGTFSVFVDEPKEKKVATSKPTKPLESRTALTDAITAVPPTRAPLSAVSTDCPEIICLEDSSVIGKKKRSILASA